MGLLRMRHSSHKCAEHILKQAGTFKIDAHNTKIGWKIYKKNIWLRKNFTGESEPYLYYYI